MEYVFIAAFVLYLAPWMAAEAIEHRRATTIGFLTVGLGWTGVGWLAAATWVARDWPRERPPRPDLVLVASAAAASAIDAPAPPRLPRAAAVALLVLALCGAAHGLRVLANAPAEPEWTHARVAEARAVLRMGPGERWGALGGLTQSCPVRVLEREGAWRRVWRLEGCDAETRARTGWVRIESLVGHAPGV